jgi:pantoate--beta-alanine ligase
VVARLFALTHPARAYVGQKDYQQTLVIRRLIEQRRLPIRLRVLPTVREPDGLAMSSRNRYLRPAARARAGALPRALRQARRQLRRGARATAPLLAALRQSLRAVPGLTVDYLAVADAATLRPLRRARGRVVVLAAVRLDGTRLIDNVLVDVS